MAMRVSIGTVVVAAFLALSGCRSNPQPLRPASRKGTVPSIPKCGPLQIAVRIDSETMCCDSNSGQGGMLSGCVRPAGTPHAAGSQVKFDLDVADTQIENIRVSNSIGSGPGLLMRDGTSHIVATDPHAVKDGN